MPVARAGTDTLMAFFLDHEDGQAEDEASIGMTRAGDGRGSASQGASVSHSYSSVTLSRGLHSLVLNKT